MKRLTPWEREARRIVKDLMEREDVNYKKLAVKLDAVGVVKTNTNLSNMVQGGAFSLAFFLQVLAALEVKEVDLSNATKIVDRD